MLIQLQSWERTLNAKVLPDFHSQAFATAIELPYMFFVLSAIILRLLKVGIYHKYMTHVHWQLTGAI